MKLFKKSKKSMKILRICEIVVVLLITGYIVWTFIPQTKEMFKEIKQEQSK